MRGFIGELLYITNNIIMLAIFNCLHFATNSLRRLFLPMPGDTKGLTSYRMSVETVQEWLRTKNRKAYHHGYYPIGWGKEKELLRGLTFMATYAL